MSQASLDERIRAGGAVFHRPTSYGTGLARGKPVAELEGLSYVQKRWLHADVSPIKAQQGDRPGNLIYRRSGATLALMCRAASLTFTQISKLAEPGAIASETVITPCIFGQTVAHVPHPAQEEGLNRADARCAVAAK